MDNKSSSAANADKQKQDQQENKNQENTAKESKPSGDPRDPESYIKYGFNNDGQGPRNGRQS